MSYLDERPASEGVGGMVLRVGLGLVAALVVGGLVSGGFDRFLSSPERLEVNMESQLLADPNFGQLYVVLKEEFPEEYSDFKTRLVAVAQRGGNFNDGFGAGRQFMLQFLARHRREFQQAPEAELLRARDLNIQVIEMLAAESKAFCARFGMSGLQSDDRPSNRALKKIGQAGSAQLLAIAAGRDNPTARDDPTEEDGAQFVAALSSAGLPDAEIDMLLQGGTPLEAQPIERQCEMSLAVYRSLAVLPSDGSARLTAAILIPAT